MSGYYDQSHFIKSFKSHTGLAPVAFYKEIKENPVRFLQYPLGLF